MLSHRIDETRQKRAEDDADIGPKTVKAVETRQPAD